MSIKSCEFTPVNKSFGWGRTPFMMLQIVQIVRNDRLTIPVI